MITTMTMISKSVLLVALGCQSVTNHIDGASAFSFVPLTRRSSVEGFSEFGHSQRPLVLLGASNGEEQLEDDVAIAPQESWHEETTSPDNLNLEKFQADLEEFAVQEDTRQEDEEDALELKTTVIPWKFRGEHDIYTEVTYPPYEWRTCHGFSPDDEEPQTPPVVLLVHGFGCSTVYWRHTATALARQGYTVYATDLLGLGRSAKPTAGLEYSTPLWAEQLDDFCRDHLDQDQDLVLVGNSVGSLVALLAATGTFAGKLEEAASIRERLVGIGMFNCGIGLNVHGITRDPKWNPVQRFLLEKSFAIMESPALFGNLPLVQWILETVATKPVLRMVLRQLYKGASDPAKAVDDALVDSFADPVQSDPASAARVLSQILTNDAGPTPMEVHAQHDPLLRHLPIHVVWGESDTVTPVDGIGGVAQFYQGLAKETSENGIGKVTMETLPECGHVLFDEVPEAANGAMLRWLNEL